jgi:hypothetical protein
MKPNIKKRVCLAKRRILSLDIVSEEDNLHLWVNEAKSRLRALREGKAREIAANEVFMRARAAII